MNTGALQWTTEKYYERVGNSTGDPIHGIVYAPPTVIEYASNILNGDPSTWHVNHIMDWTTFEKQDYLQRASDIATLFDNKGNSLVFLIKPDRWIRLNTPESLDAINYVTQDNSNLDPIKTLDRFPWSEYILKLASLYRGIPERVVLSKSLLKVVASAAFLEGMEKNIGVLQSLCMDPKVVNYRDSSNVTCNLLTTDGSVEHWIIYFRFDKSINITKIEVNQLKSKGTFSYNMIE